MAITKTEIDILLKARADLVGLKTARGELGGLQREIKETNASFKSLATTGKNILGTVGIGLSGAAMFSQVTKAIDYASKVTELSKQANISTDAFQALAAEARHADVSQEQLARTLAFLRKSIGETVAGTGEARRAFKGLGLDAAALSKLPTERALELIARASAGADDKAAAYAYTLKILGEDSRSLTTLLQKLAKDGFDGVAESAKNVILDPQQLAELKKAKNQWEDFVNKATVDSAKIISLVAKMRDRANQRNFAQKIDPVLNAWYVLRDIVQLTTGEVEKTSKAIDEAKNLTDDAAAAMAELAAQAERVKLLSEAFAEAQKFATDYITERQKILDAEYKRTVSLNEEAAKLGQEQADAALDALPTLERHKVLQERLNELNKEAVSLRGQDDNDTFSKRLQIQKAIEKTTKDIAKINEGLTGSLDAFFDNIDGASSTMDLLGKKTEKTKNIADELGLTFSSAFEDAIVEGKKFSEVLKGLAQDILRIIVRKSITEPIASGISGFFGSLFGGGRAAGGPVSAGTAYMVGEKGPELFVPGFSGTIVPNHQVNAMAASGDGGDTFNFNYSFTGGVTRGEMADIIPQIVEASKAAVLDAKRRRQPGFA